MSVLVPRLSMLGGCGDPTVNAVMVLRCTGRLGGLVGWRGNPTVMVVMVMVVVVMQHFFLLALLHSPHLSWCKLLAMFVLL